MYYNGNKLLSLKDINGNTPEIYICTTNRTGGKTVFFSKMLVDNFKKRHEKFCIFYRFVYELDGCADAFFKDIRNLFFKKDEMIAKKYDKGSFVKLFLNKEECGYAIALNRADQIKKKAHIFSDVAAIFMDEFQSENNHYCCNEIEKFISVHTSIARGNGEQCRRVPVYLCGNPVSLLNPYYATLGISSRLKPDTNFLRGNGFVLEQGYIESASTAQKKSGFNTAFSEDKYVGYSSDNLYLKDSSSFIEKMHGKSKYLCTIKYNGKEYGLREFEEDGILYCDERPDKTDLNKIAITTEDHNINYIMLRNNSLFVDNLRYFFEKGCFRFSSLLAKDAILTMLAYR